jgi:hypothetical protein
MSGYTEDIIEATGCSPEDAEMIEEIMRNEIFHSTLDWQTEVEFRRAARKAAKMLEADREVYEKFRDGIREAFWASPTGQQLIKEGKGP